MYDLHEKWVAGAEAIISNRVNFALNLKGASSALTQEHAGTIAFQRLHSEHYKVKPSILRARPA